MNGFSLASKYDYLVCPLCEVGELRPASKDRTRCDSCGCILGAGMVLTLEQIGALPDALG